MHENRLRLRTYRQVWRLEQVIYQIERVRLPFPVTFRQIGIFGGTLAAMALVSRIPPISLISPMVRYALIPGLTAWYLTSRRLDGKLPHKWLLTMLRYWAAPKRLNRLHPIADGARVHLVARVGYRTVPRDDAEG